MLGLHLVWCLWFSQKPIIIQDAREGVERLIKALENRQNTMECLHGLPASSTVTQKGTFWFCGRAFFLGRRKGTAGRRKPP